MNHLVVFEIPLEIRDLASSWVKSYRSRGGRRPNISLSLLQQEKDLAFLSELHEAWVRWQALVRPFRILIFFLPLIVLIAFFWRWNVIWLIIPTLILIFWLNRKMNKLTERMAIFFVGADILAIDFSDLGSKYPTHRDAVLRLRREEASGPHVHPWIDQYLPSADWFLAEHFRSGGT